MKMRLYKLTVAVLSFVIALAMILPMMTSCGREEFMIYSCGSGFYFNRSADKTYTIKGLNVSSNTNYFYLEDYFVSEKYGKEYKIKSGWSTAGTVYLAKKTDHYNPQQFDYNLDTITENVITITPNMNNVRLYSSDPSIVHDIYISIESRDMPVDIVFENVNLRTSHAVPVIFSASTSDINITLVGDNIIQAGDEAYNVMSYTEHVQNGLSTQEQKFYDDLNKGKESIQQESQNTSSGTSSDDVDKSLTDHMSDFLEKELEWTEKAFDAIVEDMTNVIVGDEGAKGLDGVAAMIHMGGISFSGSGNLVIGGGRGADGGDASTGVLGLADGGDAGAGGCAVVCGQLLIGRASVLMVGGEGGVGGAPASGIGGYFGSEGNRGEPGKKAAEADVLFPYSTDY